MSASPPVGPSQMAYNEEEGEAQSVREGDNQEVNNEKHSEHQQGVRKL